MASPLYSTRFFGDRNSSSNSLTVPAGKIHVVRCIDVFFGGGAAGGNFDATGAAGQTFAWTSFTALQSSWYPWRGRQIFFPGETWGYTAGIGLDVTISGYVLTSP